MEGAIKVVVTAHPILAALIHGAWFLACDFTFTWMNGELNEWVAIWHRELNEREPRISFPGSMFQWSIMSGVTVACIYSNGATKEAFRYIWEGLFNAVKTAIGKGIKFKVFDDMEVAQVQGLGATITQMKMNDPSISQITEDDPDILVQYLIKLCYVHWDK